MTGQEGLLILRLAAVSAILLQLFSASAATGGNSVATSVYVNCRGAPGVADAEGLCRELDAVLPNFLPSATVTDARDAVPRMEVTITASTPRSIAATVRWVDADGRARDGTPLQTSFFDRNSDPELRKGFWQALLGRNPPPF